MRRNNERTWAQQLLETGSLYKNHLTSSDVVAGVLLFVYVSATVTIVLKNAPLLNFQTQIKIKTSIIIKR